MQLNRCSCMDSVNSSVADISNVSIGDLNESNNLNNNNGNANNFFVSRTNNRPNSNSLIASKKKKHHSSQSTPNSSNNKLHPVAQQSPPDNSAPAQKKRKHHKHIKQSFQRYIRRVFGLTHHNNLTISEKAKSNMNSFMNDLFDRVLEEAITLARRQNRNTISENEMDTAAKLILHGELYTNCKELYISAHNAYKEFEYNVNTNELESTNLSQLGDANATGDLKKVKEKEFGGLDDLSNISAFDVEDEKNQDIDNLENTDIEEKDIMGAPESTDSRGDEKDDATDNDETDEEEEGISHSVVPAKEMRRRREEGNKSGIDIDTANLNSKEIEKMKNLGSDSSKSASTTKKQALKRGVTSHKIK